MARIIFAYMTPFLPLTKRLLAICDLLQAEKFNIPWSFESHMKHIVSEDLEALYRAGNRKMAFGVESASDEVLGLANRRYKDIEQIKQNIRKCRELASKQMAILSLVCLATPSMERLKQSNWLFIFARSSPV